MVPVLRALRARQAEQKLAAGGVRGPGIRAGRRAWSATPPRHAVGLVDNAVKASGLRRIRLHDTRHTVAALMLQAGVPVLVVSQFLGHSSVAITLDVYGHLMPGQSEDAFGALSAVLFGT